MTEKWKQEIESLVFQEWVGETERNDALIPEDIRRKQKLDNIFKGRLRSVLDLAEEHFGGWKGKENDDLIELLESRDEEISRLKADLEESTKEALKQGNKVLELKAEGIKIHNQVLKERAEKKEESVKCLEWMDEYHKSKAEIRECHEGLEVADRNAKSTEHLNHLAVEKLEAEIDSYKETVMILEEELKKLGWKPPNYGKSKFVPLNEHNREAT